MVRRGRAYVTAVLAILICIAAPTATHGVREPINGVITQIHTFLCNNTYLFEINVTSYMVWMVGYSNSVDISIRAIDPLPTTRISATISIDRLSVSRFLGYLKPQEVLHSSVNISLVPALFQIQGGAREVKQAQLSLFFIELRCSYTIPIWFILSASNTSLETVVQIEPDLVEVNSSVAIYVELKNPTHESFTDVEVYVYVNRSLIKSLRIDVLDSERSIRADYIPTRMGVYVVEVETIYTASYTVRKKDSTMAVFIAKGRPSLSISSNTTFTYVGGAVLISGSIEPRTRDLKIIQLEVSTDGVNWSEMGRLETAYRFNYTWRSTLPNIYYIRARVLESQLFYPALSNVVTVAVERVRPSISISVAWPYLEAGSKALIRVEVSPPIIDTVEVLYRLTNEISWSKMNSKINRETSSVELPLTRPGVYEVKVVVPESAGIYRVESNTIQLYVSSPKTLTTATEKTSEMPQIPYRNTTITIALIVASAATALLILMMKRR